MQGQVKLTELGDWPVLLIAIETDPAWPDISVETGSMLQPSVAYFCSDP